MTEAEADSSGLESEPSASLTAGICAWAGLLVLAAPMMLARSLSSELGLYASLAVFFSLWIACGGVVLGYLEARKGRYDGLIVLLTALGLAVLQSVIIAVGFGVQDVVSWAFVLVPMSLGPLVAPLAAWAAQGRRTPPLLTLIGLWVAPSLGLIVASLATRSVESFWDIMIIAAHLQFGPWLRPVARVVMPLFPSIPGSPPEWRPEYWVDVPIAVVITAAMVGLIVIFVIRSRFRPALIIPYASLAGLWMAMGLLQIVPWIHQGE